MLSASPRLEHGWLSRNLWTLGLLAATLPPKEGGFVIALLLLAVPRPIGLSEARAALADFWPMLLLFLLGCVATFASLSHGFVPVDVARSLFYLARIPLFFLLGVVAMRRSRPGRTLFRQLLLVGAALALLYITRYALDPEVRFASRDYVRSTIGHGEASSALVPFAAALLWRSATALHERALLLAASLLSILSIALATSRFYLIVIVLSALVVAWPARGRRNLPRLVLVILSGALLFTTPVLSRLGLDAFLPAQLGEIVARDASDIATINNQWRGYETFMAFRAAEVDGLPLLMIGHGFSANADLGLQISLAGKDYQQVGVFHNVFAYLIVHFGVLGILLYLVQFALLAAPPRRPGGPRGFGADRNRVYVLALLTLAIGSPVLGGLFNDSTFVNLMLFLLGSGAVTRDDRSHPPDPDRPCRHGTRLPIQDFRRAPH